MNNDLEMRKSDYERNDFLKLHEKILYIKNEYEKVMIKANKEYHKLR